MHRTISSYLKPFPSCLNPFSTPVFFVEFGKRSYVLWKYYWINPFILGIGALPNLVSKSCFFNPVDSFPFLLSIHLKQIESPLARIHTRYSPSAVELGTVLSSSASGYWLLVLPWKQNCFTTILYGNQKQNLKLLLISLFSNKYN